MSASEDFDPLADHYLRRSGGSAVPFTRCRTGISDRHRLERNHVMHPPCRTHCSPVRHAGVGRSRPVAPECPRYSSTEMRGGRADRHPGPPAYISDRVGTLDVALQRSAQPGGSGTAAVIQARALLGPPLTVKLSIVGNAVYLGAGGSDPISEPVPASRQDAPARGRRDARRPASVRGVCLRLAARSSPLQRRHPSCNARRSPRGSPVSSSPCPAGPTREFHRQYEARTEHPGRRTGG